jgi:hypothetical protein
MNTRPWVPCLGLVVLAVVACSLDQRSRRTVSEVAERQTVSLAFQQEISGSAAGDDFATSVSIDGTTAIVGANEAGAGAGAAYVFVLSGSTWVQQAAFVGAPGDLFGTSVSVRGDTAAVGAPGNGSLRGAVYVFARSGTTWSQQAVLRAADGVADDQLGASVAVSGGTIVGGAPFRTEGSSTDRGAAYVFTSTGTQQAKLGAGDAAAFDMFGNAVAIDGGTIAVGAPYKAEAQGAAYVFAGSGTSWPQQAKLTAGDPLVRDRFGASVAISSGTILVGAPDKGQPGATFRGAAYVFTSTGTQQAKLVAPDAAESDVFGSSVSIQPGVALVGAPGEARVLSSALASAVGAAYVFSGSGTSWSLSTELTASDGIQGDMFSDSASITSGPAVVGAPFRTSYTGAAYFYSSGTTGLPNGSTCSTNSQCTSGICAGGRCCGTSCSGPCNACSTGTCAPTNGTPCNDGNACTLTDTCQAGVCTGSNAVSCTSPPDACHTATGATCNTSTGACTYPAVTNGTSCSDGNACTLADTCQAGVCTSGAPVSCTSPPDACHTATGATCNTSTGVCTYPAKANGTSCNDGNACTLTDTCQAGVCTGSNPAPNGTKCSSPTCPKNAACFNGVCSTRSHNPC